MLIELKRNALLFIESTVPGSEGKQYFEGMVVCHYFNLKVRVKHTFKISIYHSSLNLLIFSDDVISKGKS